MHFVLLLFCNATCSCSIPFSFFLSENTLFVLTVPLPFNPASLSKLCFATNPLRLLLRFASYQTDNSLFQPSFLCSFLFRFPLLPALHSLSCHPYCILSGSCPPLTPGKACGILQVSDLLPHLSQHHFEDDWFVRSCVKYFTTSMSTTFFFKRLDPTISSYILSTNTTPGEGELHVELLLEVLMVVYLSPLP